MEKYGDPTFSRHAAASKVLGLAVLRTADSVILPFSMSDYAAELKHYATEVREDAADASPKHGDFAVLDFDQLDAAVEKIGVAAQALEEEAKTLLSSICPHANPIKKYFKIRSINQRLSKFERKFIDETGT